MDWINSLKTFIKVVEINSFAGAARQLHTNQSAVSKRIAWIEQQLNSQLMVRSTRHLALTDAGKAFYQRALNIVDDFEQLKNSLSNADQTVSGRLHIITIPLLSDQFFVPHLPKFLKKYPDISIDIRTSPTLSNNLMEQGFDLFIGSDRYISASNTKKIALLNVRRKLYAAPSYLKRHGTPKTIADLKKHNCLVFSSREQPTQWQLNKDTLVEINSHFYTDDRHTMLAAAKAGLGIIWLPTIMAEHAVSQNKLVNVLKKYTSELLNINMYIPNNRVASKRVQLFIDYLSKIYKAG